MEGIHLQSGFDVGREALKWIAIATMTIDHIGAVLYPDITVLRIVGRLALPIFCYLLTLGVKSEIKVRSYIVRLFSFALIAQVPYSLAFGYKFFDSPNILFTLFLGVIILQNPLAFGVPIIIVTCILYILNFDLGLYEMIAILCMHTLNDDVAMGVILFILFNVLYAIIGVPIQIFAVAALPIIFLYKSGHLKIRKANKDSAYPKWRQYFFYIYYPLHLTALYLIKISFF